MPVPVDGYTVPDWQHEFGMEPWEPWEPSELLPRAWGNKLLLASSELSQQLAKQLAAREESVVDNAMLYPPSHTLFTWTPLAFSRQTSHSSNARLNARRPCTTRPAPGLPRFFHRHSIP